MYTILMNTDKSLIATNRINIYQRENAVDKIQFLLPQTYEDLNLSEFEVVVKYVDQGNVAHSEILELQEELYKEKLQYILPVTTKITQFAGDVKLCLSVLNVNLDNDEKEEVLHTGETIINVKSIDDIFAFTPKESLETIDKKILELQVAIKANTMIAESIDQNKANDLSYENNTLQLLANGKPIGTSHILDQQTEFDVVEFGNSDDPNEPDSDADTFIEF